MNRLVMVLSVNGGVIKSDVKRHLLELLLMLKLVNTFFKVLNFTTGSVLNEIFYIT